MEQYKFTLYDPAVAIELYKAEAVGRQPVC